MLMSLLPLVALNFQTPCPEMNLNQGLFLQNGQTGYILKPSYLRDQDTEFDPITLTKGPWLKRKSLHVMASGSPTPFLFCNIWTISLCCSCQLHSFFSTIVTVCLIGDLSPTVTQSEPKEVLHCWSDCASADLRCASRYDRGGNAVHWE